MHELKTVDVGHAVTEAAGEFDHFRKVGVWIRIVDAGVFKILDHELIGFQDHAATDGFAGELIGNVLELVIDGAVDLGNGIVEKGEGRFRKNDRGDALGIALGIVTKLGDLLFGVDFGEFIIMEFGIAALWVGEDVDGGEEIV